MPTLGVTRRKRYGGNTRKPMPYNCIIAAGVSVGTFVVLIVILAMSAAVAGEASPMLGGISMLAFIAAVVSFAYICHQMKKPTEFAARIACLVISGIVFIIWLSIYILGLTL